MIGSKFFVEDINALYTKIK